MENKHSNEHGRFLRPNETDFDYLPHPGERKMAEAMRQHAPAPDYSIDRFPDYVVSDKPMMTDGEIREFSRGYDEGFEAAKTLPHGVHAKLAAATAVIERVRALTEREPAVVYTREIREALAAAPEQSSDTAECGCCPIDSSPPCMRVSGLSHMQAITDVVFGVAEAHDRAMLGSHEAEAYWLLMAAAL